MSRITFKLTAPLSSFPSDNRLDSMTRRERIGIKRQLKNDVRILTLQWLTRNRIPQSSISWKNPLFKCPVRTILTIYKKNGSRNFDVHNLSIKSFLDSVVSMGILADDSVKQIPESIARFGGFVAGEGYAEFEISEME